MPMVDEDVFAGRPLARIFLALKLREARRVEALLDDRGVSYIVRVETVGHTLFGSPRRAASFFVEAGQADYCEGVLVQAGLGDGIVRDPPGGSDDTLGSESRPRE